MATSAAPRALSARSAMQQPRCNTLNTHATQPPHTGGLGAKAKHFQVSVQLRAAVTSGAVEPAANACLRDAGRRPTSIGQHRSLPSFQLHLDSRGAGLSDEAAIASLPIRERRRRVGFFESPWHRAATASNKPCPRDRRRDDLFKLRPDALVVGAAAPNVRTIS
jgi:hypothetical protein